MNIGLHVACLITICMAFGGGMISIVFPGVVIKINQKMNQRFLAFLRLDNAIPGRSYSVGYVRFVGIALLCIGVVATWIYISGIVGDG